jgi:hypothetical protein
MKALLISKDLMFITRVKEVASAKGGSVVVAKNEAAVQVAVGELKGEAKGVVLIDLEKCPLELGRIQELISELPGESWKRVSFYSHVHVDAAIEAKARDLGQVMPRSKFVQLLPGLFI